MEKVTPVIKQALLGQMNVTRQTTATRQFASSDDDKQIITELQRALAERARDSKDGRHNDSPSLADVPDHELQERSLEENRRQYQQRRNR